MAITNAQQAKQILMQDGGIPQLVKKGKGKKRPGYRGDDAARSDRASGRSAGRADPGGSVERGARCGYHLHASCYKTLQPLMRLAQSYRHFHILQWLSTYQP